jgi:hypothetical protein
MAAPSLQDIDGNRWEGQPSPIHQTHHLPSLKSMGSTGVLNPAVSESHDQFPSLANPPPSCRAWKLYVLSYVVSLCSCIVCTLVLLCCTLVILHWVAILCFCIVIVLLLSTPVLLVVLLYSWPNIVLLCCFKLLCLCFSHDCPMCFLLILSQWF